MRRETPAYSCPACPDAAAAWGIALDLLQAALDGDTDARRLLPAAIDHWLRLHR